MADHIWVESEDTFMIEGERPGEGNKNKQTKQNKTKKQLKEQCPMTLLPGSDITTR